MNYLKLSSKMDAMASKLDSADKSMQMSNTMQKSVAQLQRSMDKMTPEQMAQNMGEFEKIFEDLDVRTDYMNDAIDSTTATTTPADQVDSLIQQVGEEYALDVGGMINDTSLGAIPVQQTAAVASKAEAAPAQAEPVPAGGLSAEDDLERRLAQLKGIN